MSKPFIIGLAVFTCLAVIAISHSSSTQTLASSKSPNQVYEVEIAQKRDAAGIERYVYLNAYRDREPFIQNKLLYTGDLMDDDFRSLYPQYSWLSESILKIGQTADETGRNDLSITNETSNRIRYLLIETYNDKYMLFDVEPQAVIKLKFKFWGQLSCQGVFATSQKGFGNAAKLLNNPEGGAEGTFSINITEDTAMIESSNSKLKPVTCCAVDRPDIYHENF